MKLCECGCGKPAPIAKQTRKHLGHVRGEPTRFAPGHYKGWREPKTDITARFWAKVERMDDCWLWVGRRSNGYGYFDVGRKSVRAHRFAYELERGPIPDGLELDHLCEVKNCVNPAHLEAVAHAENVARIKRLRKTHCPHGHPYEGSNLYIRPDGHQACRRCRNEASKRHRRAKA
jgi:hypothetical protein